MKEQINKMVNFCLVHSYTYLPVVQVKDTIVITHSARICNYCGHCHSSDWQRARDYLHDALVAGLNVEAAPSITREVHRPVVTLPAFLRWHPTPRKLAHEHWHAA